MMKTPFKPGRRVVVAQNGVILAIGHFQRVRKDGMLSIRDQESDRVRLASREEVVSWATFRACLGAEKRMPKSARLWTNALATYSRTPMGSAMR
jgi:hypothetical protein